MKLKNQTDLRIFTLSWLSCLVAVTSGLIVVVGVMLVFSINHSQAQQQLIAWQNTSTPTLTVPGQSPPGTNTNSLQNTWPLLGFWAITGLAVYFIVESITKTLKEIAEFRKELDYVHARRNEMIRDSVIALVIRLLAMIAWLFFIEFFFKRLIPYSITAAQSSAQDLKSRTDIGYALLSFSLIALSMYLHTVFLRIILRRPRVFSTS